MQRKGCEGEMNSESTKKHTRGKGAKDTNTKGHGRVQLLTSTSEHREPKKVTKDCPSKNYDDDSTSPNF